MLPEPEEEVTAMDGPSVTDGEGKGEVEPIEPVLLPVTTKVDEMGPGDKNQAIVRSKIVAHQGGPAVQTKSDVENKNNSSKDDKKSSGEKSSDKKSSALQTSGENKEDKESGEEDTGLTTEETYYGEETTPKSSSTEYTKT